MDAEHVIGEPRQLAHRHAVAHRHGKEVGDTLQRARGGGHVPLRCNPADRVGAVEHDHGLAAARRLLHQQHGRRRVAVIAGTDVLQVHEHDVRCIERRDPRQRRPTVEAIDW